MLNGDGPSSYSRPAPGEEVEQSEEWESTTSTHDGESTCEGNYDSSESEGQWSSEGSSPDPYRTLQEMTSNKEDEWTTTTDGETDYDSHAQPLSEQGGSPAESEYVQELDRENAKLKAALADCREENNRQWMELLKQEEEIRQVKAAFWSETEKGSTLQWHVDQAEQSNKRLQEERDHQDDRLWKCLNERAHLKEEIRIRDKALKDLHDGLEKTDALMEQQAGMIESYQEERQSWDDVKAHSKSDENKLLRIRLFQAQTMASASEDMCRSIASQLAVNMVNLAIARENFEDKRRAEAYSPTFVLNGRLAHYAELQSPSEDQIMTDVGYPSPAMAMSISSESDKGDPMEIDLNPGVDSTAIARPRAYWYQQDKNQTPESHPQQTQSETQPNKQFQNSPKAVPISLHGTQQKPFYSPQMNWEATQAQYLNASDSETSSNDKSNMGTKARKRPRWDITTIGLPKKHIRICRFCGMADQDSAEDNLACKVSDSSSNSPKPTTMGFEETCPTHKELFEPREMISTGVQTDSFELRESISAGAQIENDPMRISDAGVQADCLEITSKEVPTATIHTSSTSTQTYPVYIWSPENGTLQSSQRHRKSFGQGSRWTTGKVQLKRLRRANSMPNVLDASHIQPQSAKSNQLNPIWQRGGERMQGCIAGLVLLGCLIYFWYCTKDDVAWINANKVPRLLLAELQNSRQYESLWMRKLNYGLVTLLNVDRVTLG